MGAEKIARPCGAAFPVSVTRLSNTLAQKYDPDCAPSPFSILSKTNWSRIDSVRRLNDVYLFGK